MCQFCRSAMTRKFSGWPGPAGGLDAHTGKYFLNLVQSNQIWNVIKLFRLIWCQMKFYLMSNQSRKKVNQSIGFLVTSQLNSVFQLLILSQNTHSFASLVLGTNFCLFDILKRVMQTIFRFLSPSLTDSKT